MSSTQDYVKSWRFARIWRVKLTRLDTDTAATTETYLHETYDPVGSAEREIARRRNSRGEMWYIEDITYDPHGEDKKEHPWIGEL